jgi:cold shock CspA family protein
MPRGKIKRWTGDGWGIIETLDGGPDVFAHISHFANLLQGLPLAGMIVEFDVVLVDRARRTRADNIRIV